MRNNILELMIEAQREDREVCVFGTGDVATGRGYYCLKVLGIKIDFFSDNNPERWGKCIIDELYCIPPKQLIEKKSTIVFIMIADEIGDEVQRQLNSAGLQHIIKDSDIRFKDWYIDILFGFGVKERRVFYELKAPGFDSMPIPNKNKKRIAVYTCITGAYDHPQVPSVTEEDLMDYYVITDNPKGNTGCFVPINIHAILPKNIKDNVRKNRFCKIMGAHIFSEYDYSIYIDGNNKILGKISSYTNTIGEAGISLYKIDYPFDCIYQIGEWVFEAFDQKEVVTRQMQKYYIEGMPRHWGAFNCNCLVRDNHNERMKQVMCDWWKEVFNYSYRDQASFTYALWKNGYNYGDVNRLVGKWDDNPVLVRVEHNIDDERGWKKNNSV